VLNGARYPALGIGLAGGSGVSIGLILAIFVFNLPKAAPIKASRPARCS
jgi:hypothetical protein